MQVSLTFDFDAKRLRDTFERFRGGLPKAASDQTKYMADVYVKNLRRSATIFQKGSGFLAGQGIKSVKTKTGYAVEMPRYGFARAFGKNNSGGAPYYAPSGFGDTPAPTMRSWITKTISPNWTAGWIKVTPVDWITNALYAAKQEVDAHLNSNNTAVDKLLRGK